MAKSSPQVLIGSSNYLTGLGVSTLIKEHNFFQPVVVETNEQFLEKLEILEPKALILVVEDASGNFLDQVLGLQIKQSMSLLAIIQNKSNSIVDRLIKTGFKNIITSECGKKDFTKAVKSLAVGDRFLSQNVIDVLLATEKESTHPASSEVKLSAREREVLQLIVDGFKTQEIADELHVSVHTINSHRKNMLKKLGLKSPIELIVYALEQGLVKS